MNMHLQKFLLFQKRNRDFLTLSLQHITSLVTCMVLTIVSVNLLSASVQHCPMPTPSKGDRLLQMFCLLVDMRVPVEPRLCPLFITWVSIDFSFPQLTLCSCFLLLDLEGDLMIAS